MSDDKTDGGAAFGQVVELRCVRVEMNGDTEWEPEAMLHGGLTVRDYFAAKAMNMRFGKAGAHIGIDEMAAKCYAMADAMLAARTEKRSKE